MLRQVITVMMGNVDAGKSQIIDTLKRTKRSNIIKFKEYANHELFCMNAVLCLQTTILFLSWRFLENKS